MSDSTLTIITDDLPEVSRIEKHMINSYIESLSPKEKKSYIIAKNHLGDSFSLEKSVGFIQFRKRMEHDL
jgi:hypothetical protein